MITQDSGTAGHDDTGRGGLVQQGMMTQDSGTAGQDDTGLRYSRA